MGTSFCPPKISDLDGSRVMQRPFFSDLGPKKGPFPSELVFILSRDMQGASGGTVVASQTFLVTAHSRRVQ
jgi:hypothetical protein